MEVKLTEIPTSDPWQIEQLDEGSNWVDEAKPDFVDSKLTTHSAQIV